MCNFYGWRKKSFIKEIVIPAMKQRYGEAIKFMGKNIFNFLF